MIAAGHVSIQAIETRYAGCRFRSRLEARWAVFFDRLGIRWEYEPQGVHVSWRLSLRNVCQCQGDGDPCLCARETFPYLPDFWLPDLQLWAEVKGSLGIEEGERLLNAAASLSSNDGSGCHDNGGHDLVVLGPIPRVHWSRSPKAQAATRCPWRLHMHKGDLMAIAWPADSAQDARCPLHDTTEAKIATDYGGTFEYIAQDSDWVAPERITQALLGGCGLTADFDHWYPTAINAARSARFEHGEGGR